MSIQHPEHHRELVGGIRELADALPPTMGAFTKLHGAALADGELPAATKELMALAIGIVVRCEGCITLHVRAALKAGASPGQVSEAIGVAVMMGGGPAVVHGVEAHRALEQFAAET